MLCEADNTVLLEKCMLQISWLWLVASARVVNNSAVGRSLGSLPSWSSSRRSCQAPIPLSPQVAPVHLIYPMELTFWETWYQHHSSDFCCVASSRLPNGAIAGIVVGAVFGVSLVALLWLSILFLRKRQKRMQVISPAHIRWKSCICTPLLDPIFPPGHISCKMCAPCVISLCKS